MKKQFSFNQNTFYLKMLLKGILLTIYITAKNVIFILNNSFLKNIRIVQNNYWCVKDDFDRSFFIIQLY